MTNWPERGPGSLGPDFQLVAKIRADVIAEVVAALRAEYDGGDWKLAADFIEREFGEGK